MTAVDTATAVAALFVDAEGCYAGLPGVEVWHIGRDARTYAGPHPVVAHPPCQRWARFAEGHPITGRVFIPGNDFGCFHQALVMARRFGGVIEHPKDSKAFGRAMGFGLGKPASSGWSRSNDGQGWICQVEQGHYGHFSRKPTWLYACRIDLPDLIWGRSEQRLPAYAVERYGYEKARRIGVMAAVGGKHKTRIREATPPAFRDVLLTMARSVSARAVAA